VTVQVLPKREDKPNGLHCTEVTARPGGMPPVTVIVAPAPAIAMALPASEAPTVFVTDIGVLLVTVGESVTLTVAATPSETTLALTPVSRHV
jgi:hypothetical protein